MEGARLPVSVTATSLTTQEKYQFKMSVYVHNTYYSLIFVIR